MPNTELFINDINACRHKYLTYNMNKLFLAITVSVFTVVKRKNSLSTVDILDGFFVLAEFSLTVCSWRTQCLSGPQGWSKSSFLHNMLILEIALDVKSLSIDFVVGLYSWAWDDFQSSAWEDKIICLSKSIEPRRWKKRLAKVFS